MNVISIPVRKHLSRAAKACSMTAAWLIVIGGLNAAHALQTETFTLNALPDASLASRVSFDFGSQARIDEVTGPQTGLTTGALLNPPAGVGVRSLLAGNPTVTATLTYDPALITSSNSVNSVAASFGGGGTLFAVLAGGTSGSPLTFSNESSGFNTVILVNNARLEPSGDTLFLPGGIDIFAVGMSGGTNGDLSLANGPPRTTKLDLLSDPFFVTTYNGLTPLPTLPSLTVTLAHPDTLRLSAPQMFFRDLTGTALSDLNAPATLPVGAAQTILLSLPFQGLMTLSIDAADYANGSEYAAATTWLSTSGFRSATLVQSAGWEVTPIPEPSSTLLMLLGVSTLLVVSRKRLTQR